MTAATHLERLAELEREIADAAARQQALRTAKADATADVQRGHATLVAALETDLEGDTPTAKAAAKALTAAEKRASEPHDARIEAAGRLIEAARRRRGEFIRENLHALTAEIGAPGLDWPARVTEAFDAFLAIVDEYPVIAQDIERISREGERPDRVPDSPLDRQALKRLRATELHPPLPRDLTPIAVDAPPDGSSSSPAPHRRDS